MNGKVFILTLLVLSCVIATVHSTPHPRPDDIELEPSNTAENTNRQNTKGTQDQNKQRKLFPFLP